VAPVDMDVNSSIRPALEAFDRLPSQTLPRKAAKPAKRLTALAQALSRDWLRKDARKDAYAEMFAVLDGLMARHKQKGGRGHVRDPRSRGRDHRRRSRIEERHRHRRVLRGADDRSVEADFKAAGRVLSPDLARKYADHIAVSDEMMTACSTHT